MSMPLSVGMVILFPFWSCRMAPMMVGFWLISLAIFWVCGVMSWLLRVRMLVGNWFLMRCR